MAILDGSRNKVRSALEFLQGQNAGEVVADYAEPAGWPFVDLTEMEQTVARDPISLLRTSVQVIESQPDAAVEIDAMREISQTHDRPCDLEALEVAEPTVVLDGMLKTMHYPIWM